MPSLWEKLGNVRYTKAAETYARQGGQVAANRARSGPLATTAVVARATAEAEAMPESPETPPPPPPGPAMQALQAVASGVQTVIGWEQKLTAPFGMIPFPAFPALRVLDFDIGLPHAHNHPPNITPPNPVPVPLPSTGPVIQIPFLSGASSTMINMMSAARCGDMGLGVWCGGFFPMYEVFLGSSSVWVEGARAARLGIDITKHCTFSVPKPSDPPLGPMIGTTVGVGSANVMIGGVPLPSLFSLACAQLFKALFKGAGLVMRRATAKSYVAKLLKSGTVEIAGAGKYVDDVGADLLKMAQSPTGRSILKRIEKSGKKVTIRPYTGKGFNANAGPTSWDGVVDAATGLRGPGSDVVVQHTPGIWTNHAPNGKPPPPKGTSSDAILNHEMNHAANATEGKMSGQNAPGDTGPVTSSEGGWDKRWNNFEEYDTTHADNAYRRENGLPQRTDYGPLP
jgi:uncharacterized Zn-binding protein involved in type VI secretion